MSLHAEPLAPADLKRTPLHALHVELGARFAAFAGYEMPIQFESGILKEHLHTRAAAGVFDVSHMGQVVVRPRDAPADAARALESVMPIDVLGLREGRQRYGFLTNESGGIFDDLMMANRGDHWLLIVNASRKDADCKRLRCALQNRCSVELLADRALIALQGPQAGKVLSALAPEIISLRFLDVRHASLVGAECIVSRSGYTGEDGFEISVPAHAAERLARALLEHPDVESIGLGARDSLRLEAGLCLYGADMDEATSPVEARLAWAIPKVRRAGGARAGGFPGAEVILRQLAQGTQRQRVGLRSQERTPIRAHAPLYAKLSSDTAIGTVTSGTFGPSVNAPVAMAYVESAAAMPDTTLYAEVRGRRVPVNVSELPFVPIRYKRS
jgi:glycine cleavage system T protein (aminomethyltransferase)